MSPAEAARVYEAKIERNETFLLFFPEALFAGIVALGAPVWAVRLMFDGHVLAGVLLLASVAFGSFGFFWFMRRREKWLAYFSVVGVLFVAYLVNSAVEPPRKCEAHAQPCNAPDFARKAAQGR